MFVTAQILGEILKNYFLFHSKKPHSNCRVLVPGLTPDIAKQIHSFLNGKGITSYLVIDDNDDEPDEGTGRISAAGLTSKRIGSFIAIAIPGQLVHIQDSIRGSGGTIRSPTFSEEWPWIDNGSEAFRFDGPVLDNLVNRWTSDPDEQEWMRVFTLNGLVQSTKTSSARASLLLEKILGTFKPSNYPRISGARNKFLFHSGVPKIEDIIDVDKAIDRARRLGMKVVDRCQNDEDVREQTRDMVTESNYIPNNEKGDVRTALDGLLDGLGRSTTTGLGLLAFHSCWGPDSGDPSRWLRLTAGRLAQIFNVDEREKPEVKYNVNCDRGIIAGNGKKLASFMGEIIQLDVSYNIPHEQFKHSAWKIQVLNRLKVIDQRDLGNAEGQLSFPVDTQKITTRYLRKIPVRIALLQNGAVDADARLDVHLCGQKRPAFVVVEPGFHVFDATLNDSEEVPDKKLDVDMPVHLHLFSHHAADVSMCDENEKILGVIETGKIGIWRSEKSVDVNVEPSGQATRSCRFDDQKAVICFEAKDFDRGEFTVEDEIRIAISNSNIMRLDGLADLFIGNTDKPYSGLGRIDDAARQRISIANTMSTPTGWRPLLFNLFESTKKRSNPLGKFVNYLGRIDEDAFRKLQLPKDALSLLEKYSDTRDAARKIIESGISYDGINPEHPVYASHPIFSQKNANKREHALTAYLEAYYSILHYLEDQQKHMEWLQLFVLSYLDCAVHWDTSKLKHSFFLIGPWHPLVLAKRYMIQSALTSRVEKILQKNDHKCFRHLASLLGRVQGFRWFTGVSSNDKSLEPIYVSVTSDPGWHLAFKTECDLLAKKQGLGGISCILDKIQHEFGLTIEAIDDSSESMIIACISSYVRAYPSRRSIGVRIKRGYAEKNIVSAIDRHIHSEEGPTKQGLLLSGGIRLYLEEKVDTVDGVRWSDPPLHLYYFSSDEDEECIQNEHPDIYMLPPVGEPFFTKGKCEQPRGKGLESVFTQPLNWLTEGQHWMPNSMTCEFDACQRASDGVGGAFAMVVGKTGSIFGNSLVAVRSIDLPQHLGSPWVTVPGKGMDPAALVKYARYGTSSTVKERVLWDYKLDIARTDTSFFVLSTVPKGFQVAVNGFFHSESDIANDFIADLAKFGISIGGESLRSGRHALGVIGLVGAVRLFSETQDAYPIPIVRGPNAVGFLVPVDPFASFFGRTEPSTRGKRGDLLAVQMVIPDREDGKMAISCCAVEAKFTSTVFDTIRANNALKQAAATANEFRTLIDASLCDGAMPERLGLMELIRFGLRISSPSISSPSTSREIEAWTKTEAIVYKAILRGNYEYCPPSHDCVLVTTESQLPGTAIISEHQKGLWVRLNKRHWPGILETQQVNLVREKLSSLFHACTEQVEEASNLPNHTPSGAGKAQEKTLAGKTSVTAGGANPFEQVFLGVDDGRKPVYFSPQSPVDPLDNMNLMVTGSSGTGKTQLLKYIICKAREQGKSLLILDFKNDFASDGVFARCSGLERVFVNFDGLPYNPLIPYPIRHPGTGKLFVQCGQHIAGIASVLRRTYKLGAQQQATVKNAMVESFASAGIPTTGSMQYSAEINFPDLSHVGDGLKHDNPSAYNRLDPLFTLDLFKGEYRKFSFQSLVEKSTILDLSQIPSDEIKNTLAQLIVMSCHAYYNSQPHSGAIRQVLVFDEAHRVLNSDYMLKLVRECRAYGIITLLSSQYPSDFPSEISASMATKIIHGNGRDSEKVKDVIQLLGCEGREGDVANLERFQAFIDNRHHPHTLVRTITYPHYLVWKKLQASGAVTREDISQTDGIDASKLPIGNLIRQIEHLGIAEECEGNLFLLNNDHGINP